MADLLFSIPWILAFMTSQFSPVESSRPLLSLLGHTARQDQGAWIIDLHLCNCREQGVLINPEEFRLKIEGWVSNSRITSHAVPRWSSLSLTHNINQMVHTDVIAAAEDVHRCRENLTILVWAEEQFGSNSEFLLKPEDDPKISTDLLSSLSSETLSPSSLGPGETLHVRLRIDHQHTLYGEYDPLLGTRAVQLSLGSFIVQDVVALDREQYLAQPKYFWPNPPDDRRDTRYFISEPDSLHLEADVYGHRAYRYQELPVRYDTRIKLQFWYLIASGTEGECCVRVGQNKDTPHAWRQLHEAAFEEPLTAVGRWTKFERTLQIKPEATKLILEFKITGDRNVGEMWIDDVCLRPLNRNLNGGP